MAISQLSLLLLTAVLTVAEPWNQPPGFCVPFKFTSSDPSFNFKRNGLCQNSPTGSFGSGGADCCFSGSGAMFVGPQSQGLGNKAYGNTILECTIASSAQGQSVCDISLIDGYSVPIECDGFPSADKSSIGGTTDLWSLNNPCPQPCQAGGGCSSCINPGGHSNNVAQFFTDPRAGNYWSRDDTAGKTTFVGVPQKGYVECRIGSSRGAGNQGSQNQGQGYQGGQRSPGNALGQRDGEHRHAHQKKRGLHARRLHNLLGDVAKHGA